MNEKDLSQVVHVPVLQIQVLDCLHASEGGRFLDCTLGGGGHSLALLNANETNEVLAVDRDMRALGRTDSIFEGNSRMQREQLCFGDIGERFKGEHFDGVLADLGVSTFQLFEGRGFSFTDNTPLDMRMDEGQTKTAHSIVNETSPKELFVILKKGGVGKDARSITDAIVRRRPVETTRELAKTVAESARSDRALHPATLTFQAIRIEVNQELKELEKLLDAIPGIVAENGRVAIITFHSIEDRMVTSRMRKWQAGSTEPPHIQVVNRERPLGKLLTRKAIVPDEEEVSVNPASRSARLRVFEFSSEGR